MSKTTDEPWYAEKRAMAYVTTLFAMHKVAVLEEVSTPDYRIDLVVDLKEEQKWGMQRRLGVEVKGFREFPSTNELNRRMSKDPVNRLGKELGMPLLVCAVQFVKLEAVYCWILEPVVEDGKAGLRIPDEYEWRPLEQKAVSQVLKNVGSFYRALYDVKVKK